MGLEFITLAPTLIQVLKAGEANPNRLNRIVYGQATSDADGVATLYFTDNGSASGNSLLTTIEYAVASVYSTNPIVISRPKVIMREKNIAAKYVSANVTEINGLTLPVLGVTVLGSETPMNGAVVDFMILGSYEV